MKFSNFHTHTSYCDGKDTPRELVRAALEYGFSSLGFSGHGYTPFDESYCMSREKTEQYHEDILNLKSEFSGQIAVYLGCEEDIAAPVEFQSFDYVITSSHYVKHDGAFYPVDESEETFLKIVRDQFNGDPITLAEVYYDQLAHGFSESKGQIAGHLDLITKYNEGERLFSEDDPRYRRAALSALEAARGKFLELNTGAMARGIRKTPYPAPFLLKEAKAQGFPIIITSDCHDKRFLAYEFKSMYSYLKFQDYPASYIYFSLFE